MARNRGWDLPFPQQLAATSTGLVTSIYASGADMGIEPDPFSMPAPFPQPVTASQMWLSTSDGHLPNCPAFPAIGKH